MSKFLIFTTTKTTASGAGSQTLQQVIGIDGIATVRANAGNNGVEVIYSNSLTVSVNFTDALNAGDASALNFFSKQIINLAASSLNTFNFPSTFPPNVLSTTGKRIGIGSIS